MPFIIRLVAIFAFQLLTHSVINAQQRISGGVTDATGEPVPFATVFFANTTFGTSTTDKGLYTFSGFPPGKYDLIITAVGYKLFRVPVEIPKEGVVEQNIQLATENILLKAILVKPDTANWKKNFEDFKDYFLGKSYAARETIIQNEKDIHLFYDASAKTLVAHASKPIIIINRATGYVIKYYLNQFEYGAGGLFTIDGLPQFEAMTPNNKAEQKRWERRRQEIYLGSILHFMRSCQNQRLGKDGFKVFRAYRILNSSRLPDEELNRKIKKIREEGQTKGTRKPDSLSFFLWQQSLPLEIDSVVKGDLKVAEFCDVTGSEFKTSTGLLKIEYRAKEDPAYAYLMGRMGRPTKQRSTLIIRKPLTIFSNGYYEDSHEVLMEGYWSWSERMATMLPLDYQPAVRK